jgi:hypothetical protein
MQRFKGILVIREDRVPVGITLTETTMTVEAGELTASWPIGEVEVYPFGDRLDLMLPNERAIIQVSEGAGKLALALGVRSAPPLLRRRMAAAME